MWVWVWVMVWLWVWVWVWLWVLFLCAYALKCSMHPYMHVDLQFVLRDSFDGVSPGGQNSWRDTRVGLGGARARPLEGRVCEKLFRWSQKLFRGAG